MIRAILSDKLGYTGIEYNVRSIVLPRDPAPSKRCKTCYLRGATWKFFSKTTDVRPLGRFSFRSEVFPRHKWWKRERKKERERVVAAGGDAKMVQHLLESSRVFPERNVIPIVTLHLLWQSSFSSCSARFFFPRYVFTSNPRNWHVEQCRVTTRFYLCQEPLREYETS